MTDEERREYHKRYNKTYYQQNREKRIQYQREYYAAHREQARKRARIYYLTKVCGTLEKEDKNESV